MRSLKTEKIGIFGGAFDPPHKGHETALEAFLEQVQPDAAYVIPSGIPPHKELSDGAGKEERLALCRLAFSSLSPKISLLREELEAETPSYTYLTLENIRSRHPKAELFLFVGTDQFLSFDTWKHPERILSDCTLCVMDRFGNGEGIRAKKEELKEKFGARILLLEEKAYIISSTEIRTELKEKGFSLSLSPSVNEFISEKGLYGTDRLEKRFSMVRNLKQNQSPHRFSHILGVEREVSRLCSLLGYEKESELCLAALYHDATKHWSENGQLEFIARNGIEVSPEDKASPQVLHGITASFLAEQEGIFSEDALLAIRYHTTGREGMTLPEKILYFADFTEETRDPPVCHAAREQFSLGLPETVQERRKWLDVCLLSAMENTLFYLTKNQKTVHPLTLRAKMDLERKELG